MNSPAFVSVTVPWHQFCSLFILSEVSASCFVASGNIWGEGRGLVFAVSLISLGISRRTKSRSLLFSISYFYAGADLPLPACMRPGQAPHPSAPGSSLSPAWNALPSACSDHQLHKALPDCSGLTSPHFGACLQLPAAVTESLALNYMLSAVVGCWLPEVRLDTESGQLGSGEQDLRLERPLTLTLCGQQTLSENLVGD